MPLTTLLDVVPSTGDPSTPAIIIGSGGPVYSRAKIRALALRFAARLRDAGIIPGDVVTIAEPNTLAYVVAFLGITWTRAIAAPLNQNYTTDEFRYYMQDAGSRLLVVGPDGNANAEAAEAASVLKITPEMLHIDDKEAFESARQAAIDPPQAADVALFLHTSGTTSKPKGVPLTHGNLVASITNITQTYEFTPEDVSLLVMPLFHVHGLMAGWLSPMAAGAVVVLPAAGKFSASSFWKDASTYRVTYYTAVPTMHQVLVARAEKDFPNAEPPPLRVIRSCSSSLAPATLHQVEAAFGAPVLEAYAMTEASHQMTSNPLPSKGSHKPGTVGRAQGSVEVAMLDENCRVLPIGEIGEVCIRGPNVTAGYRDNPAANEEAFKGGWFHTGDQGKLDAEGYLTLTGRIKELINRGGEKISPLEVDGELLSHPWVAEAVSFAAPDEKYGEIVAAAVVLTPEGKQVHSSGEKDVPSDIMQRCAERLATFKIPSKIFITDQLPKSATGKIQRRFMAQTFYAKDDDRIDVGQDGTPAAGGESTEKQSAALKAVEALGKVEKQQRRENIEVADTTELDLDSLPCDGAFVVARALARLGVKNMFGVPGIPVTRIASAAQACGIRFISCRNEQAASYAASAAGFLNGFPGVVLSVSGPGVVHALAGVANARVNGWPMVLLSGSCESDQIGKGAFQELDQVAAVRDFVKVALRPQALQDIPSTLENAFFAALHGRPGAAYVDLPSNIVMDVLSHEEAAATMNAISRNISLPRPQAPEARVNDALELLSSAKRPLLVIGKGAAYSRAETALRNIVETWQLPFLTTSMARGIVPDDGPLCVNAARSHALGNADVALLVGARLNWQLHFGEPPKWSENVTFITIDVDPDERQADLSALTLKGDASAVSEQLLAASSPAGGPAAATGSSPFQNSNSIEEWKRHLLAKASSARDKLAHKLHQQHAAAKTPLTHTAALVAIRDELNLALPAPIVVSEGANTMDQARMLVEPVKEPRCRLDAGTWGTMGVGPGYALAAAVVHGNERSVVAIEGDSAFGFSAMEVETACRYGLPIAFLIFNNQGIYGGDRRDAETQRLAVHGLKAAGWETDPAPTSFVPGGRYDALATGFGGRGVRVSDGESLKQALREALGSKRTTVIDIEIDPESGVESGNVHAFNAPRQQAG